MHVKLLFTFLAELCFTASQCANSQPTPDKITHYIYPLNKLECPKHPRSYCSEEYLQEIKADIANVLTHEKYSIRINLTGILRLFQTDKCHFSVNNFHGVDIFVAEHHPILLKRPTVGWLWRRRRKGKFRVPEMVWMFQNFVNVETHSNHSSDAAEISLAGSPFGVRIPVDNAAAIEAFPSDRYIRLNISHYSMQTKPWNCDVVIYLFPTLNTLIHLNLNFPATFDYDSKFLSQVNILSSKIPSSYLVISDKIFQSFSRTCSLNDDEMLRKIHVARSSHPSSGSTVSHKLFFLINLNTLEHVSAQIVTANLSIIKICSKWNNSYMYSTVTSDALNTATFRERWKTMSSVMCNNQASSTMLTWNIHLTREDVTFGTATQNLLDCENKISSKWILDIPQSPAERKAHAFAHVWKLIMGNYSYSLHHQPPRICRNGKIVTGKVEDTTEFTNQLIAEVKFDVEGSGIFQFPVVTDGDPNYLRFLSCGKRGLETFSIAGLFKVYDNYIWLSILFAITIVSIFLRQGKPEEIIIAMSQIVMALIRSLLEQGDPFSFRMMESRRHQLIIGAFLLVAIIISNAFKNTNILNLIIPRQAIPYENLQQLVDDKFALYSRTGDIRFPTCTRDESGNIKHTSSKHDADWTRGGNPNVTCHIVKLKSEVAKLNEMMKYSVVDAKVESNHLLDRLEQFTKLHKRISSSLTNVVKKYVQLLKDNGIYAAWIGYNSELGFALLSQFSDALKQGELNALFEEMRKCDRLAVLLPIDICNNWQRKLRRLRLSHVFIGKETYFSTKVVFRLEGLLPHYIIQRVKSTHESGIWARWENLTMSVIDVDEVVKPEKPSMSGNIIMIFALFLTGMVFASVSYIFELLVNYNIFSTNSLIKFQLHHWYFMG